MALNLVCCVRFRPVLEKIVFLEIASSDMSFPKEILEHIQVIVLVYVVVEEVWSVYAITGNRTPHQHFLAM